MPIAPLLERERRCRAAALGRRPLIVAARGVVFNFIRRSEADVDASAIRLPTGKAGLARCGVMLVGVRNAAIVLCLEFILRRAGRGVAAQPELSDELLALFVVSFSFERLPLLIGDDV